MAGRRIWLAARNQVELVGRLAAPAEERVLPSGDRIATFRLVVDRPEGDAAGGRSRQRVDTLDCVAWAAAVRHRSLAWAAGDVIDLAGRPAPQVPPYRRRSGEPGGSGGAEGPPGPPGG